MSFIIDVSTYMDIFKNTSFTWWQTGLLKWASAAFGIAIGAYWPEFFKPFLLQILAFGIVSGVYLTYMWIKQK